MVERSLWIPYARKVLFDDFFSIEIPKKIWKIGVVTNKTPIMTETQRMKDKIAVFEFQKRQGSSNHSVCHTETARTVRVRVRDIRDPFLKRKNEG